jgi:hypothetical protein
LTKEMIKFCFVGRSLINSLSHFTFPMLYHEPV